MPSANAPYVPSYSNSATAPEEPEIVMADATPAEGPSNSYTAPPLGTASTTTTTTYTIPPPTNNDGAPVQTATPVIQGGNVNVAPLGSRPGQFTCPYCNTTMQTKVNFKIDVCTILAVVIILLLFWPLFWIPLLVPQCKTAEHYCTNCHRKLGENGACGTDC